MESITHHTIPGLSPEEANTFVGLAYETNIIKSAQEALGGLLPVVSSALDQELGQRFDQIGELSSKSTAAEQAERDDIHEENTYVSGGDTEASAGVPVARAELLRRVKESVGQELVDNKFNTNSQQAKEDIAMTKSIIRMQFAPNGTPYERERIIEKTDIWAALKNTVVRSGEDIVMSELVPLARTSAPLPEGCSQVVKQVKGDKEPLLTSWGTRKPVDAVDFAAGNSLKLTDDEGDVTKDLPTSVEELVAVQRTIRLLVGYGLDKLGRFGNTSQLKVAADLIADYAVLCPGFDMVDAGANDLMTGVVNTLAAIELDNESKPNYESARPERRAITQGCTEALDFVLEAQAHTEIWGLVSSAVDKQMETNR